MLNKPYRFYIVFILACSSFILTGCSSRPEMVSGASVEVAPHTHLMLPRPQQLGYDLTASQLVIATWQGKTQQLPVQLQVTGNELVLAGFSSWGTRLLSLQYANNHLTTDVMAGLGEVLPQPEQVLFNLMITLWPVSVWQPSLERIGWSIQEQDNLRTIYNTKHQAVMSIRYGSADKLAAPIYFEHSLLGYKIEIQTLSHQKEQHSQTLDY